MPPKSIFPLKNITINLTVIEKLTLMKLIEDEEIPSVSEFVRNAMEGYLDEMLEYLGRLEPLEGEKDPFSVSTVNVPLSQLPKYEKLTPLFLSRSELIREGTRLALRMKLKRLNSPWYNEDLPLTPHFQVVKTLEGTSEDFDKP